MKRVTIPKLLPPPLSARQSFGLLVEEAITTCPEANTTSYSMTFEQANPYLCEKKEIPPLNMLCQYIEREVQVAP